MNLFAGGLANDMIPLVFAIQHLVFFSPSFHLSERRAMCDLINAYC